MKRFLLVLGLPVLAACGGSPSGPAGPGPAADPVAVTALDGWTDHAVAADISPTVAVPGSAVSVSAPGFLTRQQTFDGTPIALWPATEAYTTQVVYGWTFSDGPTRLVRWERPYTVTLDPGLAGDAEIVAKVEATLAEISRLTGVAATLGPGGAVTVGVDPSLAQDGAIGDASIEARGGAIVSARVRLVSREEFYGDARSNSPHTLLHELGHVAGLWHSPSASDVMHPGGLPASRQARAFSTAEQTALHMMYAHRRPGNLPVDREPGPTAAAGRSAVLRVRD